MAHHMNPPLTPAPTLDDVWQLLKDISNRQVRTETRLVKLLLEHHLDSDGNPLDVQ